MDKNQIDWGSQGYEHRKSLLDNLQLAGSLLIIGVLVHGVFIMKLGFYWDDWPLIWVYNSMGTEGIARYYAGDRPFAGWIYSLMFPYLGISPVGWHVAALALRCLSSILLFFVFSAMWPEEKIKLGLSQS